MTPQKTKSVPLVQIEVLVPVDVPAGQRARFEQSLARFLFGNERVRPELSGVLAEHGVDFNHLASLAAREPLGVCPSPGAVEFVPSDKLAEVCRRHGIDLTSGGCALMTFTYDAYDGAERPSDALEINIKLPGTTARDIAESAELTEDVATALFGDCRLSERARAYLRTHGVDLETIAAHNRGLLGGDGVPFTSRVSPEIHAYLRDSGFDVDRFGRFDVRQVDESGNDELLPSSWSKTTCC
ncbi:hypothetical protein [Streptomyces sp. NBC_00572]|uniref:hypothetical protein n=1 Tax=Streptomyces sp. NBC_00572 TaxID=2903664 RepID=UPI00224FC142|nr:hypothetical protein [Streptomyces sp. NBC_00572]MCX4985323.1 hypothetical protein [Streptomyces sp. NBC_00572]